MLNSLKLPHAISFHGQYWRCYYHQEIVELNLEHGYVIGPIAQLRFTDISGNKPHIKLTLNYWNIVNDINLTVANWNQLATVIKYHNNRKTNYENWLSG